MDDSFWLTPIAIVTFLFVVLPYLGGPILIKLTLKLTPAKGLVTVEPERPLPEAVRGFFEDTLHALEAEGFAEVGRIFLPQPVSQVKALLLLGVQRKNKDAAMASVFFVDNGKSTTIQNKYVEFVTRFQDGSLIQTNNSSELGSFPQNDDVLATQFPDVDQPQMLYRIHKAIVDRRAPIAKKILRLDEQFGGDPVAYLHTVMTEDLDDQIKTGYMYQAGTEGEYRPTWKGAFLMTWKELWPAKAIRRSMRKKQAKSMLAEILGNGRQFPP